MEYDSAQRLIKATDAKGKVTAYGYDILNRITGITDPMSGVTGFTYDANGNLLTVTDANAHVISYTYTVRDKVATMTDQLLKTETYCYDWNDNVISVKDRKGRLSTYSYDKLDRITKASYADGSYTSYTYDSGGRLTYLNDSVSGPIQYIYSNNGCSTCGGAVDKLIQEITPSGSISYEYDAIGRRTRMTVAGQPAVNYSYDTTTRLTQIKRASSPLVGEDGGEGYIFNFTCDVLGRRNSLTLPNGVTTNYTYDNGNNLLELKHLSPLSSVLEALSYSYDANGNRISMSRPSVSLPLPQPVSATSYNDANRMLTFNDKNMTYDANGKMTSVTNSCGTTSYDWDASNRLVGINGFNSDCSELSASFEYDAVGRRIEKTINGETTQYLYDGIDIVQEIKNNTVYADYIRTLNIDEPLARIKTDGTIRFYQTDALGSVIALTDDNGVVKTQYSYDPFGNVTVTGEISDNPFHYTGRENDGTGLYYYRARYYSPELQRFISEDPIGFEGGINLFAYVGNNPVNFIDPSGQVPLIVIIPVVAGVINGGISAYKKSQECNADFMDIFQAFGNGAVGGITGSTVGLGIIALTGNPYLAGAGGGLTGNLAEQGLNMLSGVGFNAVDPFVATISGGALGKVPSLLFPTRGRFPSIMSPRNIYGPNSQRLIGQEATNAALNGGVGTVAGNLSSQKKCGCR
jgi:RHS repeat-associated protein